MASEVTHAEVGEMKRYAMIWAIAGVAAGMLSGCSVRNARYQPPLAPALSDAKNWNTGLAAGEVPKPADDGALAHWWSVFGDTELTSLEERALKANLDLRKAVAEIQQACATRDYNAANLFRGIDVGALDRKQRARLRRYYLGFVFQGFNLLARTNAVENVELPLIYRGMKRAERRERAFQALELVGLSKWWDHTPAELSGGQQQRGSVHVSGLVRQRRAGSVCAVGRSAESGSLRLCAEQSTLASGCGWPRYSRRNNFLYCGSRRFHRCWNNVSAS